MRFFSSIRLVTLGLWLGAAVFFIFVAQSAFTVLPTRELAGVIVNRTLAIVNFGGMGIGLLLILTSLLGTPSLHRFWLWIERFLLLILTAGCAVGQFVISQWLSIVRSEMGKPIDEVALEDPLRIQFNTLHEYSVWVLMAAMIAALLAFFIISNRKYTVVVKDKPADPLLNDFKI